MARRAAKSKNKRSVDFSQEVKWFEPDMEYRVRVKAAGWEDGNEHPYIAITFAGTDDDNQDSELYHNASTSPKALHRTRLVLEALGIEIEDGQPMDIDTDELVDLECMIHTFEDEYRGTDGEKKKSVKADDFWPVDDKKAGKGKSSSKKDDDDDKSTRGAKGKTSSKSKKDSEPADRKEVEALDDRDDMIDLIDTYDLEVDAEDRKLKKDDKLLEAIIAEMEEKDLFAEAEKKSRRGSKDKDDDAKGKGGSKRGSGKSSKKSQTWTEDEISEMSEEELDKVIEEADIELDLSEHRTLRKKKNAMIDALEEADLLEK
jgi:hypothetical protein